MIAVEVEEVSHAYGAKVALRNLSFELKSGRRTVLLGPNGAGKSTLFGLLTQLLALQAGSIRIQGAPWGDPRARAHLGVVFQQPTLDLDLSVRQNLHYHGGLHGLSKASIAERIEAVLPELELGERLDEKVRALNGGHRRRVELVRALLHQPKVLLLDEPTVGLDVPSRRTLVEHVRQLAKQEVAVLWATHLIDEVESSDHVLVLHRGQLRACGQPSELMAETETDSLETAFVALTQETRA